MNGKYILLSIFFMAASGTFHAGAQTLNPDANVTPDETSAPQAEAMEVISLHNTPSDSYKDERNLIRKGNKLFEEGNFHQALEAYGKALEVNKGSIAGRYNKARALLELQSDDNKGTANDPRAQAVEIFNNLIEDARNYDRVVQEKIYYNLGNLAFNDEQYDQSIELYKNALRIDPYNQQTRENLRLAQLKKQEQENQDQNQDQDQDQQDQQQQQNQQDQQDQQQDQQDQQQQQEQPQPMTQSAQQILQTMQNKENATRKKVQEKEQPAGRPQTDKPW